MATSRDPRGGPSDGGRLGACELTRDAGVNAIARGLTSRPQVSGEIDKTVVRGPRPGVPQRREPLDRSRPIGYWAKPAGNRVILSSLENVGEPLLHGQG